MTSQTSFFRHVVSFKMFVRNRCHLLRVDATTGSLNNGGSDALYFMFWVHTRLRQSNRYVGPRDTLIKKMAGVTPCMLYYWFRQASGRVPITWNPRETHLKNCESDALYFRTEFVLCLGICVCFCSFYPPLLLQARLCCCVCLLHRSSKR